MKKGVLIGGLIAGISALFSFREVKNKDVAPTLVKIGAPSVACGEFKDTYHVTPSKFMCWHKRWVAYADCSDPKTEKATDAFSHILDGF